MNPDERDKTVPDEIQALSDERLILRETQRVVTPFGGGAVFIAYLRKTGLAAWAVRPAASSSTWAKAGVD